MPLIRRAALSVVAVTLTWSSVLAPEPVIAQQRELANPAASSEPSDLAVDRVHVDANADTVEVRLSARNLDVDGDGYLATNVELSASPAADADDRVSRLEGWNDGGAWDVRGATMLKGRVSQLPPGAVSVERSGSSIVVRVKTSSLGWSGPVYLSAAVITTRHVASAHTTSADPQQFRLGPVATTPDPTRTTVSLSRTSRIAGREPVTATITATPALPGTVVVTDGSHEIGRLVTSDGRARLGIPASLSVGAHFLRATFRPRDSVRHASSSATAALRVVRAPARATRTSVTLSRSTWVRGRGKLARAAIVVSGRALGTVTLFDGRKKLRTLVLRHGAARYTFSRRFSVGVHRVRAVFRPADPRLHRASSSAVHRLKVAAR